MRHWWLMAIHALPYQMETINELFSLLYAGHTEKGTEQGWANLKQCRRLDACLGQTRLNSFGLMGGAQGVSRRALARGGGASGSPGVSSFILTLCIRRGSQKKSRTHGRVERELRELGGEAAACSSQRPQSTALPGRVAGLDVGTSRQAQHQSQHPPESPRRVQGLQDPRVGGTVIQECHKGDVDIKQRRLPAVLAHLKTFQAGGRLQGEVQQGSLARAGFGRLLLCSVWHQEQPSASRARSHLHTHLGPAVAARARAAARWCWLRTARPGKKVGGMICFSPGLFLVPTAELWEVWHLSPFLWVEKHCGGCAQHLGAARLRGSAPPRGSALARGQTRS